MEATLAAYLTRLYSYNKWANELIIPFIEAQQAHDHPEIMKLLSHYLAAQEIWISRIQGRPAEVKGVWEMYDISTCKTLADNTAENWLTFLQASTPADYHKIIAYKNTQGNYYETPVIDIACHCVNHATYHRAQITKLMRQAGKEVINTDFITYAREVALPELSI
jgi:uncharacterized damage-inducible protein DinB